MDFLSESAFLASPMDFCQHAKTHAPFKTWRVPYSDYCREFFVSDYALLKKASNHSSRTSFSQAAFDIDE